MLRARREVVGGKVFNAGVFGPPFDHMALLVDDEWFADVGFGRVLPAAAALGLACGPPAYRLEVRPRVLEDFRPTCWYQQTAPESPFLQGPLCSLSTPDGRITLTGAKLIRTSGGDRTESEVDDLLSAYRDEFGVVLPHADFRHSNALGSLPEPTRPV